MQKVQILLLISQQGVERVQIQADSATEQTAAHVLLGAVSREIHALDLALRRLGGSSPAAPTRVCGTPDADPVAGRR